MENQRFWEKPSVALAEDLLNRGCLWNSFVMIGRVDALLKLIRLAVPELFDAFARTVPTFGGVAERKLMCEVYSKIRETNFSHEVLAARPEHLFVMRVGDVGWSDLGDPSRVFSTLSRLGIQTELATAAS